MHIVLADQVIKGNLGILDMFGDSLIDNELKFRRCRQFLGGLRRPRGPKVDLLGSQGSQHKLGQTQSGGSIHAGVFA